MSPSCQSDRFLLSRQSGLLFLLLLLILWVRLAHQLPLHPLRPFPLSGHLLRLFPLLRLSRLTLLFPSLPWLLSHHLRHWIRLIHSGQLLLWVQQFRFPR